MSCSRAKATRVSCLKVMFFHPSPSSKLPLLLSCSAAVWLNSAAALSISGDCIMLLMRPIYAEGACLGSEMLIIMIELKKSCEVDLFLLSLRLRPRSGWARPSSVMTDLRIRWNCLSCAMKRVRILSWMGSIVASKLPTLPSIASSFRCFLKKVVSVMVSLVLRSCSSRGCPTSRMVLGWCTGGQVNGKSSRAAFSLAYSGKSAPSRSRCTENCGTMRSNLISSLSSSFTGASSPLPTDSIGSRNMRQYCGLAEGSRVGSLMKRRTTEFSMVIFMLRMICLTSWRKKSMGLLSLSSPGSSCCRISADCSRIASLKLSAKLLLGLRSTCSPSATTSMLRVDSSDHPGSVTRSRRMRPWCRMQGELSRQSRLIFSRLSPMFVSSSSPFLKSSSPTWSESSSFSERSRMYLMRFLTGLKLDSPSSTRPSMLLKIILFIIIASRTPHKWSTASKKYYIQYKPLLILQPASLFMVLFCRLLWHNKEAIKRKSSRG